MICPNSGTVLEDVATYCEYCGYILTPDEKKSISTSDEKKSIPTPNEETYMPISDKNETEETDSISVRWVGPRIVMHIFSIIAGCLAIRQWDTMNKLVELSKIFGSDTSSFETMLTWTLIFGIIMIILGIIGLVKIHSYACCLILVILHIVAILPFADLRELLIPQSDIFLAFMVSLATMAMCGAALMKKEGVVSGWLMLICLIGVIAYITMNYESKETNNFLDYNYIDSTSYVQCTIRKI